MTRIYRAPRLPWWASLVVALWTLVVLTLVLAAQLAVATIVLAWTFAGWLLRVLPPRSPRT